jgi:acyl-CoA synthetase (NDP forming)/GNAT superfamily N-acetyltransferase
MSVFALLADGTTVEIRPAAPADVEAVRAMHAGMSADNLYLRFFSFSRTNVETEARRVCREPAPGHAALLALAAGEVIGCAGYEAAGTGTTAEVAFAVADNMHHRGIATLLLEHLVSLARSRQITTFTAETLGENSAMQRVFADAGLPCQRRRANGLVEVTIPLPHHDAGTALESYLATVGEREQAADVASLRHLLAPDSVAVIRASRGHGTAGRAILDNIRTGGYAGRLYAVSPDVTDLGRVESVRRISDLPEPPDLAVVAVPGPAVLPVARECGEFGVRALAVISSGLDPATLADLLACCRRHGMRLVGPNSFGIAVPSIGLDATFAADHPRPGTAGVVTQSGGIGLAMAEELSRLGIGISSFASVGDKLDVSGNDMLMWWARDGLTRLAVLNIESFGNPRKFARTARRVGATMPVLTVHTGRDEAGQRAASRPGATPLASREALFEQAGIIATTSLGELVEAAALLATQPVPVGSTVAIVSNVGGAGVLAADACAGLGLTVHKPGNATVSKLRALLPEGSVAAGPVDTTAAVSAQDFRRCLELVAADEGVSAVIALVLPTAATGDLLTAIRQAAIGVPVAAVQLGQAESVRMLDGPIPCYGYPEAAATAIARAARYGAWRAEPRSTVPVFDDIRADDARALARDYLAVTAGGWLPRGRTAELLGCYGIFLQPTVTGGAEVIVRVTDDHMFGPLVAFGVGGVAADVLGDNAARLTPLTIGDADRLIHSVRSARLLLGHRGSPAADLPALRDLLLRVSRLAEDLPEITDLDLNPVIARADGAVAVDARVRLSHRDRQDPFLRMLR